MRLAGLYPPYADHVQQREDRLTRRSAVAYLANGGPAAVCRLPVALDRPGLQIVSHLPK
jgi:hypothetical protein